VVKLALIAKFLVAIRAKFLVTKLGEWTLLLSKKYTYANLQISNSKKPFV